jgi:multidrug resistance efflux pump
MELLPSHLADHTLESYLIRISSRSRMIYWIIILIVTGFIAILPFVYVDISVQARGYFQSDIEKQKIFTPFHGKIVLTRIKNGIKIEKGDTLLVIDSETTRAQKRAIKKRILENDSAISDLEKLNLIINPEIPFEASSFRTDRYFIEYSGMVKSRAIQFQKYQRVKAEYERNEILHGNELIPESDFENSLFSYRTEEENLIHFRPSLSVVMKN